jgi:hypothetical protein
MKQTKTVTEDSFEKARAAFFGKVKATPSQNLPNAVAMAPSNDSARESAGQLTTAMAAR